MKTGSVCPPLIEEKAGRRTPGRAFLNFPLVSKASISHESSVVLYCTPPYM